MELLASGVNGLPRGVPAFSRPGGRTFNTGAALVDGARTPAAVDLAALAGDARRRR